MGAAAYKPYDDIRRQIFTLFDFILRAFDSARFESNDEIDKVAWEAAVSEMRSLIANETLETRLFPYLGRIYFVWVSLDEMRRGENTRERTRKYWLDLIEQYCGMVYGTRTPRAVNFLQALRIREIIEAQNTADRALKRNGEKPRGRG